MIPLLAALLLTQKAPPAPGDRLQPFLLRESSGVATKWKPGRTTIVTFCAFWCDTWKTQTTRLHTVAESLNGLPIDFVGISVDGRWTELGLRKAGMKFLSDSGGTWTASMGVNRVPYTFVVDTNGTVRWATSGVIRSDDVETAARSALNATQSAGSIYLTFDDFPSPHSDDDALLDVLRQHNVHATFFCIGSRVASHGAITKRTVEEGNSLEVHAWQHDASDPQIDRCKQAILATTGFHADLYRAPGHEQIVGPHGNLGLSVIDPYDYQRPGAPEIARRVLTHLQPGCVIQLHAGVGDTLKALPEIIEQARKRGLTFDVLK